MNVKIPVQFEDIVKEIADFTLLPKNEVKYKLWMEALDQGYNIKEDCKLFNVIAHKYNNNMIELYSNSYSFIYETMAFWARPLQRGR